MHDYKVQLVLQQGYSEVFNALFKILQYLQFLYQTFPNLNFFRLVTCIFLFK